MRAGPSGPARILLRSAVAAAIALALTPVPAVARSIVGQDESRQSASRSDNAISDFYRAREERPLWFASSLGAGAADELLALFDRADIDGLDPAKYDTRSLVKAVRSARSGSPSAISKADRLLSRAFVAYVRDLRSSGSSGTIFIDRELSPAAPQAREILQAAAAAPSLPAYIEQMGWMSPIYGQIRNAFANQVGYFDQGGAARLVRINLERARALPVDTGQRYIIVDTAAARLDMYEDGRVFDSMKVVVGKPTDQTPMLAALMRYAIVNPYWNVPPDLAAERIAPHVLSEGISYFHSKRYQVLSDWSDNPKVVDPTTIDWQAVKDGRMPDLRVRQLPGPDNAMGKVKFEFPNPQGIYLHDTNDPALFDEAARLFSGGCVRLEAAQRLAKWLYGRALVANSSKPEQKIPLVTPVPVYITYLTVSAEDGRLAYRQDVYNRDSARLAGLPNALK
ncbi:MAG TPA: L,D-transpeptidase family protein [Sphingomicrobium sp.]|nr:L,D-transpeptidase family protein [Sphingomicrobium sp.]